jgi:hypothetical protein
MGNLLLYNVLTEAQRHRGVFGNIKPHCHKSPCEKENQKRSRDHPFHE